MFLRLNLRWSDWDKMAAGTEKPPCSPAALLLRPRLDKAVLPSASRPFQHTDLPVNFFPFG